MLALLDSRLRGNDDGMRPYRSPYGVSEISLMGIVFVCSLLLAGGCKSNRDPVPPAPLSDLQRASMQTRELQGDFDTAFTAAISVLQDEGWQLDEVDKDSGIVQASSLKRQAKIGPADDWRARDANFVKEVLKAVEDAEKDGADYPEWTRWERLTLHTEAWQSQTVRIRLTIVKCGELPPGTRVEKKRVTPVPGKEQSVLVDEPAVYQRLFQKLQRAIFVRQGLKAS